MHTKSISLLHTALKEETMCVCVHACACSLLGLVDSRLSAMVQYLFDVRKLWGFLLAVCVCVRTHSHHNQGQHGCMATLLSEEDHMICCIPRKVEAKAS